MVLTKCDIQKCKQFLAFLDSEKISNYEKKTMSLFIKKVTDAVAILKNEFDSRNFEISYKHYFGNQTCHQLAWDNFNDKSTVVKMNQKFILGLSKILYSELHQIANGE